MTILRTTIAVAFATGFMAQGAMAFQIDFSWAGLKLCTSGNPNSVTNPTFTLRDVPEGTKYIRFKLVDRDVPSYNHGGGVVAYNGQSTIAPGAFKYKSPCPPNGSHTYEWRATAQTKKNDGKIATTSTAKVYP